MFRYHSNYCMVFKATQKQHRSRAQGYPKEPIWLLLVYSVGLYLCFLFNLLNLQLKVEPDSDSSDHAPILKYFQRPDFILWIETASQICCLHTHR